MNSSDPDSNQVLIKKEDVLLFSELCELLLNEVIDDAGIRMLKANIKDCHKGIFQEEAVVMPSYRYYYALNYVS